MSKINLQVVRQGFVSFGQNVQSAAKTAKNNVSHVATQAINATKTGGKKAINAVSTTAVKVYEAIKSFFINLPKNMKAAALATKNFVVGLPAKAKKAAIATADFFKNTVPASFKSLKGRVVALVIAAGAAIVLGYGALKSKIANVFTRKTQDEKTVEHAKKISEDKPAVASSTRSSQTELLDHTVLDKVLAANRRRNSRSRSPSPVVTPMVAERASAPVSPAATETVEVRRSTRSTRFQGQFTA